MNWKKLGHVFVPDKKTDWAQSHAYVPTPMPLGEDVYRVFVAFWDAQKVGRIGYVDVKVTDHCSIKSVSATPVFDVGRVGAFDDSGVTPSSLVHCGEDVLLYYFGWQKGVAVRYYLFSGLALLNSEENRFERVSEAPILDRRDGELFVRSAPFVLRQAGLWRMWYVSGDRWVECNGKQVPTYNIKYAESENGIAWGAPQVAVDIDEAKGEFGLGRPWVLHHKGGFRMWYSVRHRDWGYRLGYADSPDGVSWLRKDSEVGIDVSQQGWDSEAICFSSVVPSSKGLVMFYNGNNYGEAGFGVAISTD